MNDNHPHTVDRTPIDSYDPKKGDKPPVEDIPKALEYKLDVIIDRLNAETGRTDPPNAQPLPDPREFDPVVDPFPNRQDISKSLEFKLDVLIWKLNAAVFLLAGIAMILAFGLLVVVLWLAAIAAALAGIAAALANIVAILAAIAGVLTALFALVAFFVIRLVVPLVRQLSKKRIL